LIDVEAWARPLEGDAPCGPNLEYDPEFQALEAAARLAQRFDSRVEIEFLGVSEGVLYWREGGAHEPGTVSVRSLVERGVQRRFPDLRLREISPRSVLAEHP